MDRGTQKMKSNTRSYIRQTAALFFVVFFSATLVDDLKRGNPVIADALAILIWFVVFNVEWYLRYRRKTPG